MTLGDIPDPNYYHEEFDRHWEFRTWKITFCQLLASPRTKSSGWTGPILISLGIIPWSFTCLHWHRHLGLRDFACHGVFPSVGWMSSLLRSYSYKGMRQTLNRLYTETCFHPNGATKL
jgi:hypothetical protein